MIRSTFISFGLHSFLLTLAYFGLPAMKTKEPIELPVQLLPRLKAISSGNKNLRVYVRGDKDVPYGLVLNTIAKIKSSGFKKVALVAKLQEG